jgi:hypothetical protein
MTLKKYGGMSWKRGSENHRYRYNPKTNRCPNVKEFSFNGHIVRQLHILPDVHKRL